MTYSYNPDAHTYIAFAGQEGEPGVLNIEFYNLSYAARQDFNQLLNCKVSYGAKWYLSHYPSTGSLTGSYSVFTLDEEAVTILTEAVTEHCEQSNFKVLDIEVFAEQFLAPKAKQSSN